MFLSSGIQPGAFIYAARINGLSRPGLETSCCKGWWDETAQNVRGWREAGLFSEDLTKSIRLLEGWAGSPEPTAPRTLQDSGRGERLVVLRLPVLKIFISQAGQIVSVSGSRPLLVCFALSRS